MNRTDLISVLSLAAVATAAGYAAGTQIFHRLPPLTYLTATTLGVVLVVLMLLGWRVRKAVHGNTIGLDRAQLSPHLVVFALAFAKASIFLGALSSGILAGYAISLARRGGHVTAAATDLPVAITIAVAGTALVVAGIVVEAWCQVPPDGDQSVAPPDAQRG